MLACEGAVSGAENCVFEQGPLPRDPVQVGGFDLRIAVAAQPIGPQRVDRHQQQVQLRG